mmetsp:Transcript_36135/g.36367  ORF Transcript_36135/g.36367 Transcript_36135/m.36367 type:complete len:228 (-) Transcript_36135:381-1064(-)
MVHILVTRFLADSIDGEDDAYQHVASILQNITQIESGRRLLTKSPDSSLLALILPQLKSTNMIRRRGIAGTIKNICFDEDSAWWLINTLDIVNYILYPLAGPEELDLDDKIGLCADLWLSGPDKEREPHVDIRLLLVESILLLCGSGWQSRNTIRKQKAYVILKMADMVEEDEMIGSRIDDCVQYLRRDEAGTEEGSSDKLVPGLPIKPEPSRTLTSKVNDDYDDVD